MKIQTFEETLGGKFRTTDFENKKIIVPKPIQRNTGIKYEAEARVTYCHWLFEVFQNNEYLAYKNEAWTNDIIKRRLLLQFAKKLPSLRNRFRTYKYTIGIFRNYYNDNKLYSAQPPTLLVSFPYNDLGYIQGFGKDHYRILSFEECYRHCINLKIADPRFVQYEHIVEIRNRQVQGEKEWLAWIVPTDKQIKEVAVKAGIKEVYNSVRFPQGWTREDTPIDSDL